MTEHKGMKHKDAGIRKRVSEAVYPADILSDPELQAAPLEIKGAWLWCLLFLWREGTYKMTRSKDELARLWGADKTQTERVISYLCNAQIANVTVGNNIVTLVSRRLQRRCNAKAKTAARVHKHRANQGQVKGCNADVTAGCNADVTAGKGVPSSSFSSSVSSSETPKSTSSSPPTPSSPAAKAPGDGKPDADGSLPLAAEVYTKHPHLKALHRVPMLRGLTLEQWLMIRKNRSPFMDWPRAIAFVVSKAEIEGSIDKPGPFVDSRLGYYEKDHIRDIESAQGQAKKRQRDVSDMANFIREILADDTEPDPLMRITRNMGGFASWGRSFPSDVEALLTPELVAQWKALKTEGVPA